MNTKRIHPNSGGFSIEYINPTIQDQKNSNPYLNKIIFVPGN